MTWDWATCWQRAVPAGAFGLAAFTVASGPAGAFFPPVPTPDKVKIVNTPTSPPPPISVPPVIPPVSPPPFTIPPPPPLSPPPPACHEPPPVPVTPQVVPEPASVVSVGVGLAAVAGWQLRRRRRAGA